CGPHRPYDSAPGWAGGDLAGLGAIDPSAVAGGRVMGRFPAAAHPGRPYQPRTIPFAFARALPGDRRLGLPHLKVSAAGHTLLPRHRQLCLLGEQPALGICRQHLSTPAGAAAPTAVTDEQSRFRSIDRNCAYPFVAASAPEPGPAKSLGPKPELVAHLSRTAY